MAIGSIIGAIAAPLISSIFGGGGRAAATGAESASKAQADMINLLIDAYKKVFGPAQANIMGQYMGAAGGIPTSDITAFQTIQDLLPAYMPQELQSRMYGQQQQDIEQQLQQLSYELERRGISGPAAEALLNQIRERGVTGRAGITSGIGQWEAEQTLGKQRNAFEDALKVLGLAGQYSQVGSAFPGTAISGAGNLAAILGQQAALQGQQSNQFGTAVGTALGQLPWSQWFGGTQPATPTPTPTTSYAAW